MSNTKGQAIIIVIAILIVFSLLIPFNIFMVQNESRWTIKEKRSTTAFHLAEAGLDRGYWKLMEKSSYWTDIIKGTPIPGYNFDVAYDDIPSSGSASIGYYTIKITTGDESGEVKIYSIAKDKTNNETRALEAIYSKNTTENSMTIAGALNWKPNLRTHWGPVVCYTNITDTPSEYYPRKYCKGKIEGRDTSASPPNSDTVEYWAYEELGSPPQIKWSYYKDKAKGSFIPAPKNGLSGPPQPTVSDPPGSAYFDFASNGGKIIFDNGYTLINSTFVIYTAGSGELQIKFGSFLVVEAVVSEGTCDFNAKNKAYKAVIPPKASEEYKHNDAATIAKWNVFKPFTIEGGGDGSYPFTDAGMVGFLCVKGNISGGSGDAGVIGALFCEGDITANTFNVYYTTGSGKNIQMESSRARRTSWKEVLLGWPSWL